jgi:hypothetical protein
MIEVKEDIRCLVEVRTEHFSKLHGDLKLIYLYNNNVNNTRRVDEIRGMLFSMKLILSQIIKRKSLNYMHNDNKSNNNNRMRNHKLSKTN